MKPEVDLIPRAIRGDRDARADLYPLYYREIEFAVSQFLGKARPQDLADICQDIWLKVLDRLHFFDPTRGVKFSTWLFSLARNHCFDVAKKRRLPLISTTVRGDEGESMTLDLESPDRLSAVQRAALFEFCDRYREAAKILDVQHRRVFESRAIGGLEFHQIAKREQLPLGTVKSMFYRSVEKLKVQLTPFRHAA